MMVCEQYIFKLTSGQLAQAGVLEQLGAWQHRLVCRRCRAFTRNDAQLTQVLADYRQHLASDATPPATPPAADDAGR